MKINTALKMRSKVDENDSARLLAVRKVSKARKPDFIRQCAHKERQLINNWRKPRGLHSKMRLHKKGKRLTVKIGWKSPAAVRGLSREGLIQARVHSLNDLKSLTNAHGVIIGSSVGARKRIVLLQEIKKMGLRVLNVKDVDAALMALEGGFKRKKEAKLLAKKEEEKVKETVQKKAPEKTLPEKIDAEKKKMEEKKELDKLLTKKD